MSVGSAIDDSIFEQLHEMVTGGAISSHFMSTENQITLEYRLLMAGTSALIGPVLAALFRPLPGQEHSLYDSAIYAQPETDFRFIVNSARYRSLLKIDLKLSH